MVDLTQAHKASIELLGTRHTALVEAVRNYVNGSVQPSIDELIAAIEDVTTDIDTKEKMLLGLASRQAKKPVPSLILDFKTRHYLQGTRRPEKGYGIHDLLTVERATPKWVYNASGRLVEVPAHEPAYQHDPVTGEPQGLLIEEQRTNLLRWSEDFTNSAWGGQRYTIETTSVAAPTGGNYFKHVVAAGEGNGFIEQSVATSSAGVFSAFYLVKQAEFSSVRMSAIHAGEAGGASTVVFDLSSGTHTGINNRISEVIMEPLSDGGYLIGVTWSVELATGTRCRLLQQSETYDGVSGIYVAAAQLEQASTPSSYIPTEDAPVTRAADNVSRVLGEEFNNNAFTIYAEGVQGSDNGSLFYMSGQGGLSNSLRVGLPTNSGRVLYFTDDGTAYAVAIPSNFPSYTLGEPARVAASLSADTGQLILAINGEAIARAIPNIPDLTQLRAGNLSLNNNNINGAMSGVALYPYALSEQELIDLTS